MSVWFAIPSARQNGGTVGLWREKGYKVAVWRDPGCELSAVDLCVIGTYEGYPRAVNALTKHILAMDSQCQWIVSGGDDTDPDSRDPNAIAEECTEHFGGTFGVMQPIGDRWGGIERICGSPWMGREFCRRINGGVGPFWPSYRHMFPDEELFEVARSLGVLWQRQDLVHRHNHFCRDGESVNWAKGMAEMPDFLREANSSEHWHIYKSMFESRKATGFPGHRPL